MPNMKVVIIGGGIAGLSIGWRLARAGCETVVLERAYPGRGATWASGGMIAAATEYGSAAGPEAEFGRRSAASWPAFASELEEESGHRIFYRSCGSLIVALSQSAFDDLARNPAQLMSAAQARELEPLLRDDIAGALWASDDAQVDNRVLGMALARAFSNAGGILQVNESAVRIEIADGRAMAVRTPFALYGADAIVIAAGAWSGDIKGVPEDVLPRVIPVKGEMIALKRRDAALFPRRLVWGNDVYLVPRHDRLLVGATMTREGFDTSTSRAARDWLSSRAVSLMPKLSDWPIVEHWAGLRPGSPDGLPLIGETAVSGLFVATGQFRNGILFAPAMADALRSLIVEHREVPDIRAFQPGRFVGTALADEKRLS